MCDRKWCACEKKSRPRGVSDETLKKLEAEYAKFTKTESSSLLKKHLTRRVFDNLKTRRTSYGSSLMDVIQSGLANPDSSIGIYAPDPEAYTVFAELFDPCIEEYHGGFGKDQSHPDVEWGDPADLGDLDPDGKYVISTRVRCARSIKGYPLNPTMKKQHYTEIEEKVKNALATINGELQGTYQSLGSMDKKTQQGLIDEHFLFKEGDRFLAAANANNYWPLGRGIFFNENKTFLVWCNEEDHLRVISMQKAGDLAAVYRRLVQAVSLLEENLPFARHERLGYLTFCPSNLGTTIRASVHAKLPKLSADYPQFQQIAQSYGLQVRGTAGEHSEAQDGVYDISNRRRLGLTEWQVLEEMRDGIVEMIKQEESL